MGRQRSAGVKTPPYPDSPGDEKVEQFIDLIRQVKTEIP